MYKSLDVTEGVITTRSNWMKFRLCGMQFFIILADGIVCMYVNLYLNMGNHQLSLS